MTYEGICGRKVISSMCGCFESIDFKYVSKVILHVNFIFNNYYNKGLKAIADEVGKTVAKGLTPKNGKVYIKRNIDI